MQGTWAFEAGGRHSVAVRSELAYGTTIWLDGRILVDDVSWDVERLFRIPVPGDVALRVVGAWPLRRRAVLLLNGRPVAPGASQAGALQPRRAIPAWGHGFAAAALLGLLGSPLLAPLPLVGALAALRASRGGGSLLPRVAMAALAAAVPWLPIAVVFLFPGLLAQLRVMLQEGGPIVLPIVVVGVAATASAFFHALQAHGRSAVRAVVVTAILLGLVGYWTWAARAQLAELLEFSSPELAGELQAVYEHEAARPRQIGLTLAAASAALLLAGEVRRLGRRRVEAARE